MLDKNDKLVRKYLVEKGNGFRLESVQPGATMGVGGKKEARRELARIQDRLQELQKALYAESRQALLVVLQAMDTGGKDSTIRHVFGPLNPQGVRVVSFKAPSEDELAHDYLWRIHRQIPARGMIGIFNRSHYEDVLIARVHGLAPDAAIRRRYRQINDFERYLSENGVRILKIFLHISRKEQKERLQSRLDNSDKHWKFNPADLEERALWGEYMKAVEIMVRKCSHPHAPWLVIPANRKWYRDVVVARAVEAKLASMNPRFPDAPAGLDEVRIPR